MRWGVGAGASRLVSGTMTIHEQLEARSPSSRARGGAAVRLRLPRERRRDRRARRARARSSPTSSTTPRSSTAAGSRGPRPSSTATATSSTSPGAARGRRGRLADRHRRGLLDGRRRRAAGGDRRAGSPPRRAGRRRGARDRRARAGRPRRGRRGRAQGEVDVVIGTLGKALGSYGAYVCASAETSSYLINRRARSSSRPPAAARGRRRAGRARAARAAAPVEAAGTRRRCGASSPPPVRCRADAPRSSRDRRRRRAAMVLCEQLLERGGFAQAIRPPTVPEGSSRLRLTVMARTPRPSWAGAASASRDAAVASSACVAPRQAPPARAPRDRLRGCFVTGTDTGVGKTVVARRSPRASRAGRSVAVRKPVVTGVDEPAGMPPTTCCSLAAGRRERQEIAPLRFGPPVSPHLAAELAGGRSTARRCVRGARRAGAGDRRRGDRRAARPFGAAPSAYATAATSASARRRRRGRARHDQPHAAHARGRARARPRGRRRAS